MRLIERPIPIIAEGAVQVPRNDKPFVRTLAVINEKMVFVVAIPVLNEGGRSQIVNVLLHVHLPGEKIQRVLRMCQFLAE